MRESIFIGWDPREAAAFAVARESCRRHLTRPIPVFGLVLDHLKAKGLYRRPMEMRPSAADRPVMWDVLSDAAQSTEHANARFLVPYLAREGWALFCDGDMLFRSNVARLFDSLDRKFAVYCVKHQFAPPEGAKMDGQLQQRYARKNWSSFIIFNCSHPANRCLTSSTDMANTLPGRDLHRLCWLQDDEIGEIDAAWNFLVGHSDPSIEPKVVHFTDGVPDMAGFENAVFADLWRRERDDWARGMLSFGS
jgi:hypothetical protein